MVAPAMASSPIFLCQNVALQYKLSLVFMLLPTQQAFRTSSLAPLPMSLAKPSLQLDAKSSTSWA